MKEQVEIHANEGMCAMNMKDFLGLMSRYVYASILLILLLPSSLVIAANFPLEIIQPQPNLNTINRFYKAYPGLEYNVRMAIIGGDYPYQYELLTFPAGMTIDDRGQITWPHPVETGSPHGVSVRVTDSAGSTKQVAWTVTVAAEGFRFIDAVNGTPAGQGGTGTINKPWRSMVDVYGGTDYASKNLSAYAGEFLYWREGTYAVEGYKVACSSGCKISFVADYKPQVWLAYPGENVVFDMNTAENDVMLNFEAQSGNVYLDGLEFNINSNSKGKGVLISGGSNVVVRRCKFHGIANGYDGGTNALLYTASWGQYFAIQDNVGYDVNEGYWLLGYSTSRVLVEDNTLYDIGAHAIGPKEGTAMWFIRGNHMYNNPKGSIGLQYSNSRGIKSGNIEISYNLVQAGGGKVKINSNHTRTGLPVYIYRNTFLDDVQVARATADNGPFHFYNNIIVNETSYPDKPNPSGGYPEKLVRDKIERIKIEEPSRVIVENNLTGSASDSIVDANGKLTPDFESYLGTHGHQIGAQVSPPTEITPPSGLRLVTPIQ